MNQPAKQQSPLLTEPIPYMIRKIGIPVSVGAIFNTVYNVVDTIYGGLISDEALAALSLSFPIYFLIIAVGFGFGQGTTALIGNSLGRGDEEQARQRSVQTLVFGVIASLLLTITVIFSAPTLVGWMGATDPEYQQLALAYINPIFYGAICFITLQMINSILNALGHTKPGRNVLIAGFFLNLLLDPWFIFGGFGLPPMGITGIALATVFTQGLGSIYLLVILSRTDMLTADSLRRYWVPDWAVFKRILEQGLPSALDTLGVSLGFFMITVYVSQFGQKAVAAFGAGSRLEQLALLPQLGLNIAVVSLVARNNGAGNYARVQETWRTAMLYGMGLMFTTMLIVSFFARPLMGLFTNDPEIIDIGTQVVQIRNLGLIPNAIFFMSASALRGIERPLKALVLNMTRFLGLPWLFILLLVKQLGYGLTAIWISSTAAFFIAAAIMYFIARQDLPRPATGDEMLN